MNPKTLKRIALCALIGAVLGFLLLFSLLHLVGHGGTGRRADPSGALVAWAFYGALFGAFIGVIVIIAERRK